MTIKFFLSIFFSIALIAIIYQEPKAKDKTLESKSNTYWITKGKSKFGAYKISQDAYRNVAHIKVNRGGNELWISTDIDSLKIVLQPEDTISVKIKSSQKKTATTLKVVGLPLQPQKQKLSFLKDATQFQYPYEYPILTPDYITLLKNTYSIENVLIEAKTDIEILTTITTWAHEQWNHNGGNVPSQPNAHTILQEVAQGKNFRCVEYSIVIAELMQALGYKARVLGLKQKECETLLTGAGHAVAEVFLPEFNKWVFADGQFNAIPVLDGRPLNAVEFQEALTEKQLYQRLLTKNTAIPFEKYAEWVYPYLHYFDFKVQYRDTGIEQNSLMLVPLNSRKPKYFQKKWGVGNCLYTHDIRDFYEIP